MQPTNRTPTTTSAGNRHRGLGEILDDLSERADSTPRIRFPARFAL